MKSSTLFRTDQLTPEMKQGFARLTGDAKNYEGIRKEELYLKAKEDVTPSCPLGSHRDEGGSSEDLS